MIHFDKMKEKIQNNLHDVHSWARTHNFPKNKYYFFFRK